MDTETPEYDDPDKTGEALKAQRFQMLEDIARELAGEVVFPTHFDTVLHLRKVLHDSELPLQTICSAISMEPLVSAKLLHLANSAAFNPGGQEVLDLTAAVARLGINAVRSAAMSIAMAQIMRAKGMAVFTDLTEKLWEHSLHTAAAARVVARHRTRINPEEALLAGLIHDLGAFYMLYRATRYDELVHRPDTVRHLILQWHESIGVSLLGAIGLPEEIVEATSEHDRPRPLQPAPRTLGEVIYAANLLAGGHFEWTRIDMPAELYDEIAGTYAELIPEISNELEQMRHSFA